MQRLYRNSLAYRIREHILLNPNDVSRDVIRAFPNEYKGSHRNYIRYVDRLRSKMKPTFWQRIKLLFKKPARSAPKISKSVKVLVPLKDRQNKKIRSTRELNRVIQESFSTYEATDTHSKAN